MGKCLFFPILFVFHYTINLHKQGMFFLVTDRLEKMHMRNQMGEINSFIKLVFKLPVQQLSPVTSWLGFCATVRI